MFFLLCAIYVSNRKKKNLVGNFGEHLARQSRPNRALRADQGAHVAARRIDKVSEWDKRK
jgi:hypothetical protein